MKLYLTESGELIARELQETMGRLKAQIAGCLTEEEKHTFRNIIQKINALELH
jgi:DNA-binding MarR family transcriptional regulator